MSLVQFIEVRRSAGSARNLMESVTRTDEGTTIAAAAQRRQMTESRDGIKIKRPRTSLRVTKSIKKYMRSLEKYKETSIFNLLLDWRNHWCIGSKRCKRLGRGNTRWSEDKQTALKINLVKFKYYNHESKNVFEKDNRKGIE